MITHNSSGKKGVTNCYSISISYNEVTHELTWSPFRFYCPAGDNTDENEHNYLQCPGGNLVIENDVVDCEYIAVVSQTLTDNMCVYQLPEGEVLPTINDNNKEYVFNVFVPTAGDISIVVREVVDE
jgi:hypothetical protein